MPNNLIRSASPILLIGVAALTACGDAGVGHEEVAEEFAKSCVSSFTSEGGPADLAQPFCDCSVGKVKEQKLGALDMLNRETMESIGEECMTSVLEEQGAL